MSEILSQEEVDSLLTGLSSGKVEAETDAPPEPEGLKPYDFTSQDRVIRGRMPTFKVINDRLARQMGSSLSKLLMTNVDISASNMETLKFSDFVQSLPVPTSLHVFRMLPFRGHALLVMESQLVFNLIDTFFGGSGNGKAKIEGREFTPIEEMMIRKVVTALLEDMVKAWSPVEKVTPQFVRSEVNPQFATIVLPADLVITAKFDVELEQNAGKVTICLPYAMIEPIRHKLSSGFQSEALEIDHEWQKRVKDQILNSMVDIAVQLGTTQITGERLIHFKVGDVIQLDQNASRSLIGLVEDVPKLRGFAGVRNKYQAYKIEQKLTLE
ncbi:MAG: flagellar motor switch protein FliM [Desulfobacterales bacterium]|nr:flagellar motor switch protein FliM [Desulfobacterales bacterium]